MTEKQIAIMRRVLNDHCKDVEDLIEEEQEESTIKSLREEIEACDEAIITISRYGKDVK